MSTITVKVLQRHVKKARQLCKKTKLLSGDPNAPIYSEVCPIALALMESGLFARAVVASANNVQCYVGVGWKTGTRYALDTAGIEVLRAFDKTTLAPSRKITLTEVSAIRG